ncbi:hypothetical protein WJM93_03970 [Lactiplantibacillus plantarum]|mgnify:CR=1 FL=1|jgi:hypothetical protein|uniref:hypothetical protein n=3 Tax=Lactiplantibacillus plantarum TaxID=1590 RepID=UPI0005352C47|nr:hypothetical protein [Lactiplantibacillus plantarum]AVH85789.1 hypothetical protein [Lactobacillus phage PM411]DAV14473.1 MAG TPA: hypothetical protein [Caudoviricetes sp.]MBO2704007.1 hypothetical protein [Lactiplantibacillus plantarum]MCG0686383.1 hypothetical protein [Lactiplantibacillus plantarum]PME02963.1 hypothetical protein S101520_00105 [Lactiplantibacillus plantarum subsp. plantarum]
MKDLLNVSKLISTKQMPNMDSINRFNKELDAKSSLEKESQKAQIESRKILQQIEKNTASLAEITKLLHESNLQHDQIIDLMGDLFAISKSKDNEEAQSLYQKAISKISSVGENVGNITTLVTLATTIYNAVLPLLK